MRLAVRNYASSVYIAGNSSAINIPNTSALTPGASSFGVSFWFRSCQSITNVGTNILIQMNNGGYATGWMLSKFNNDLNIYVAYGGPSLTIANFFTTYAINNRWNHLVVTANASDLKVRVYCNGAKAVTSSAITAWNITATGSTRVGFTSDLSVTQAGYYSDVIFYKGNIPSDADVTNLYYKNIVPPGATNRYLLNEGSGGIANDVIGGNAGSLISASFKSESPMKNRVQASGRLAVAQKQNLVTYSDPVNASQFGAFGSITVAPYAWSAGPGLSNAVSFGDNSTNRYAYKVMTPVVGAVYTVSAYVVMDDGSVPSALGTATGTSDLMFIFNTNQVAIPATVQSLGNNVYRLSVTVTAIGTAFYTGVIKYSTNSAKTFKVSGFQVVQSNRVGIYTPTTAGAVNIGNIRQSASSRSAA